MKQVLITVFFVFSILCINAQVLNDIAKPSLTKYSLAEKIYLQIDNAIYQTGETIWFKAVVTKSYDNSLTDLSQILHVELIDNNDNIIQNHLLKLNNGIAKGSFNLEKSYSTGKYRVRAYTNWNRNFEDSFVFSQDIEVINAKKKSETQEPIINVVVNKNDFITLTADINPRLINPKHRGILKVYIDTGITQDSIELDKDKDDIYKLSYRLPKNTIQARLKFKHSRSKKIFDRKETDHSYSKTIVIDKNHIDLQFFPEGGKLVGGLLSTVGFKALDYNGLGYRVNGIVKDDRGVEVTSFSSNELGMGTFKLQPELGMSYHALIEIDETTYKYDLPNSNASGTVLAFANLKDELGLSIKSKNLKSAYLTVEVSSRGVKYQSLRFKQKDIITALIPKRSLPDGIVKIIVRNDKNQKLCERLFFNYRDDRRLHLSLNSDKVNYTQREKMSVKLLLDSTQVKEIHSASVLVMNKERVETAKNYKPGILAYMLLKSELKGFVERPDYYFNNSNRSRLMDLDALMLTQGWRDYNYQNEKPITTFKHQPKTNLELSGTIGEYFNPKKRPKKPLDLNLIIQDEIPKIYSLQIPENGKYHFQLDDIYKSNAEFFMQVVDNKGEPIDFTINVDRLWKPEVNRLDQFSFSLPNHVKTNFTEQMEEVNDIQRAYETTYNTIALDEVTVKAYEMTPEREAFIALHGEPDIVIEGKEINEKAPDWNFGVFSVLRSKFKEEIQIKSTYTIPPFLYAWVKNYDFTYTLVDNIAIHRNDYSRIQDIPAEEVKSVDIMLKPKDKNRYCTDFYEFALACPQTVALVNIYTKSGNGLFGIVKAKGALINTVKGFSESVAFYAPNYETLSNQDWVIPDNRSVIHWEPNITLNEKGNCFLEFYNDDYIGEVSVIVEAISKDGKIGYVEKTYTVKEAER